MMVFDICGKVAIITGGASGLGLESAKELLRNGLRGLTIADINEAGGKKAIEDIENEFGPNKAIYISVDVTDYNQFENVFKATIKRFNNIDILINNAAILNDKLWAQAVAVNVVGVINGTILGLENYIPKYKSGNEGVIVNMASVAALEPCPMIPIYCATKHAVLGLAETPILPHLTANTLSDYYKNAQDYNKETHPSQKASSVAKGLVTIVNKAETSTIWVVENNKEPYDCTLPDRKSFAPK